MPQPRIGLRRGYETEARADSLGNTAPARPLCAFKQILWDFNRDFPYPCHGLSVSPYLIPVFDMVYCRVGRKVHNTARTLHGYQKFLQILAATRPDTA